MLSYHASTCPHCGHIDAGETIDVPRGNRWMQTFRKLPTIAPKTAAITRGKTVMPAAGAGWPQVPRAAAKEAMSTKAGRGRPSRARTVFPPDRREGRPRRLRL